MVFERSLVLLYVQVLNIVLSKFYHTYTKFFLYRNQVERFAKTFKQKFNFKGHATDKSIQ